MESSTKISAAIISFNEINNIERCINSLKDVVDEIVIVDSGSTDGTVELAEKLGAKVFYNKFPGHIEQKNYVITKCSNDWIISLDCDEALSDDLKRSVLEWKNNPDTKCVYMLNRFNNYCGKWIKHCGWYPEWRLRLFQKESGSWGGENPHDKYIPLKEYRIKKLKGDLFHYSYYNLEEHDRQLEKFSGIAAKAYFEKGKRSSLLKIIFSPSWAFINSYFIKLGILDGQAGWYICTKSAKTAYLKYLKLYKLQNNS